MTFSCSIPAKTFVLGEYSVTQGSKALLLLSKPCFGASFARGDGEVSPPVAKFISRHKDLQGYRCDFFDPYQKAGGFGASSAEFLAWIKYYWHLLGEEFDIKKPAHYQWARGEFVFCGKSPGGIAPSGADMVAQNGKGLCFVDLEKGVLEEVKWPFRGLGLCLVHTGNKVATHEHLKKITPGQDFSSLQGGLELFMEAVSLGSVEGVVHSINNAREQLERLGFLHSRSKEIIQLALKQDFCLAAKGCGAMGADVILLVFLQRDLEKAKSFIEAQQLDLKYYFLG